MSARDVLVAALGYAQLGLRVVPIRAGRKHPAMERWPEAATSDAAVIRAWWGGRYRRCGVGIVTGPGSGVWVLDVDVAHGRAGAASLAWLEAGHGRLPDTVEAVTGTGGRHLFFAWDDRHRVRNDQSGRLGAGLDVRGAGGLVVAAPTVHPDSGTPYRWRAGHGPGERRPALAPDWLHARLAPATAPAPPAKLAPGAMSEGWGASPAEVFNASTTWAGLLGRDGWRLARVLPSGEQRWRRPGKAARQGTSATVGHAGRDVLKVFTTSMPGLEPDRAYSRFGYEAAVRYGGDRSALASAIRREMTGPSPGASRPGRTGGAGSGVAGARLRAYVDASAARPAPGRHPSPARPFPGRRPSPRTP